MQVRSLDQPDETPSVPNAVVEMVTIADTMVGRARFQPGWRWSSDVKPITGTDWCMVRHEGDCVSGSAIVQSDEDPEGWIAAFADPDDNSFQLISPDPGEPTDGRAQRQGQRAAP